MATFYGYIGIENLNLNGSQKQTLVDALAQLGQDDGGTRNRRMQAAPVRPDGDAAIFEAVFDTSHLTVATWKNRLAQIFGVAANTITSRVTTPNFGLGTSTLVTFGRGGTDYLRVCVFGGVSATWEQSRQETIAYLSLYSNLWASVG